MSTYTQVLNATSGVISDGVLWATTPLFAAAHLWSWHPLWAASIWTAYGIGALFPQGVALLSRMTYSPLHYNLDPLHSPICGLDYGSVMLDVPTNSGKNTMTSVWLTSIAPTIGSESIIRPNEHDTLTSVTDVEATSIDDQPALAPTSHWSAPGSEESQVDARVSSNSGITDNLARGTVLGQNRGHTSLSPTRNSFPLFKTMQYYTSSRSVAYEGLTSAIDENPSTPSDFRGLGRFRTDLSQSVSDYEIWGRRWQSWMADLTLILLFALVIVFLLAEYLRRAFLKMMTAFTTTVAPPNVPALNTTVPAAPGPAASAQATPASTALTLHNTAANITAAGPTASIASTNQQATFHKRMQQLGQRHAHYSQTFKNALTKKKDWFDLGAMNSVWGGSPRLNVLASRAVAIWFACMCMSMLALNLLMDQPAPVPPGFAPTAGTNSPTTLRAPDATTVAILKCIWQIEQCTTSAFRTHLSPDGSYKPFPTPSSRTSFICERILRMIMSYKAMWLAISQTVLGHLKSCFDQARTNPMSSSGAYYSVHHFGRTASLCAAIERIVLDARSILLHSFWGPAHQVLGCLPWYLRSSGELCPQWATEFHSWTYHIITPILLSTVVMLNILTGRHSKFLSLQTLLFVASAGLLSVFLGDTAAYQTWQNAVFAMSAALLVFHIRAILVPW